MVRLTLFFFIIFFPLKSFSITLNNQEKIFFNFLDLNNDKRISLDEVNQSIKIIFQLIGENRDGHLSESEIIELKLIIESLS